MSNSIKLCGVKVIEIVIPTIRAVSKPKETVIRLHFVPHFLNVDALCLSLSHISEYIEDICPYATFQLNKQTYSESSYSGNIYSGPYHSVRGSFVYHDSKTDGYHVNCIKQCAKCTLDLIQIIFIDSFLQSKEPEYTKVRRKGNRLRDPHSESQGNETISFLSNHPNENCNMYSCNPVILLFRYKINL